MESEYRGKHKSHAAEQPRRDASNVCTGSHCLGRVNVANHRNTYNPYHRERK